MRYDIDEIVTEAIMSKIPTIIVEGIDDIKFYDNICALINKEINVQAIETIEGYNEGCEHVLNAIEQVQDILNSDNRIRKLILGIIDRDARYYRGTMPDLECLMVLNYYSYESHLISNFSLKKLISIMTKATQRMTQDEIISFLLDDINNEYMKLYYVSLEALKASCIPDYSSLVTYSKRPGSMFSKGALDNIWPLISNKKNELDEFANSHGITINDLKYIAKGKWVLYVWGNYIIKNIKRLEENCGTKIPKCPLCEAGSNEKCLWRIKGDFKLIQIQQLLCSSDFFDLNEIQYICDRINLLNAS